MYPIVNQNLRMDRDNDRSSININTNNKNQRMQRREEDILAEEHTRKEWSRNCLETLHNPSRNKTTSNSFQLGGYFDIWAQPRPNPQSQPISQSQPQPTIQNNTNSYTNFPVKQKSPEFQYDTREVWSQAVSKTSKHPLFPDAHPYSHNSSLHTFQPSFSIPTKNYAPSAAPPHKILPNATQNDPKRFKPFLVVLHVVKESRAYSAGLAKGDVISQFGPFTASNFPGLEILPKYVVDHVEKPVHLVVGRNHRGDSFRSVSRIKLSPSKWDHGAVLGVVLDSYPPSESSNASQLAQTP